MPLMSLLICLVSDPKGALAGDGVIDHDFETNI